MSPFIRSSDPGSYNPATTGHNPARKAFSTAPAQGRLLNAQLAAGTFHEVTQRVQIPLLDPNSRITRYTSTPQLPFKRPNTPSGGDHNALNRGNIGGSRYGPSGSQI